MENSTSMSCSKSFSALPGERKKLSRTDRLLYAPAKSFSLDKFHDEVEFTLLFQNVVHGGHVLIGNAGSALSLAEQTLAVRGIAAGLGSNALECDGTLQNGIVRTINLAHATDAQAFANGVASNTRANGSIR